MAFGQTEALRPLTAREHQALEEISRASSERMDRVRRARALLAVSQGQSFSQAAHLVGFRRHTSVAKLVARFQHRGLAALSIAAGRGRKPTYNTAARAQIVATAQRSPQRREDQTATWSLSTLQRRLRQDGLSQIGTSTIRRVLQEAGSSYQRTRTWCPTGTALRRRKTGVVRVVDPETEEKTVHIDLAYRVGEELGVPVWCQDEAGPYQAIPQPGAQWTPEGEPPRLPHEYVRGGTAKLLTLFRPATGVVRAKGVTCAPGTPWVTVLHPWLKEELSAVLAETAPGVFLPQEHPLHQQWVRWLGLAPGSPVPPVRLILIWDNLAGHLSADLIKWLCAQGVLPLYTPLSGSWLNMAESLQRIIVRRALSGHHPETQEQVIQWLEETVAGWNANPTPFVWHGKRWERRQRARARRLGGSPAAPAPCYSNAA